MTGALSSFCIKAYKYRLSNLNFRINNFFWHWIIFTEDAIAINIIAVKLTYNIAEKDRIFPLQVSSV